VLRPWRKESEGRVAPRAKSREELLLGKSAYRPNNGDRALPDHLYTEKTERRKICSNMGKVRSSGKSQGAALSAEGPPSRSRRVGGKTWVGQASGKKLWRSKGMRGRGGSGNKTGALLTAESLECHNKKKACCTFKGGGGRAKI